MSHAGAIRGTATPAAVAAPRRRRRRGAALVSAILFLVILSALTVALAAVHGVEVASQTVATERLRADAAAWGGLHLAQWKVRNDADLRAALARPVHENDVSLALNPLLKINGVLQGASFTVDVWPSPAGARFRAVATAGRAHIERWTEVGVAFTDCYRQLMLSYNPVAYWRLEELSGLVAADEMNGYPGTYQNGVTLGAPDTILCETESAAAFDGLNDSVNLGAANISGNRFSVVAWIRADRFDHLSNWDPVIIAKANGTDTNNHYWSLTTVKRSNRVRLRFTLRTGGSVRSITAGSGNLVPNTWYFVAATYDGSRMRQYVNGAARGNARRTGNLATSNAVAAWIGDNPAGAGSRPFDGIIDEVAIFNTTLSQAQIQALYSAATVPP